MNVSYKIICIYTITPIAQMVEHDNVKIKVTGSIPVRCFNNWSIMLNS